MLGSEKKEKKHTSHPLIPSFEATTPMDGIKNRGSGSRKRASIRPFTPLDKSKEATRYHFCFPPSFII